MVTATKKKISAQYHIGWLLAMLWGGVVWLIPEHIYHSEVVLYPPFFTAGIKEIIPDIIKVGIPMVIATVGIWAIMVAATTFLKNKKFQPSVIRLMIFGAVIMVMIDKILAL